MASSKKKVGPESYVPSADQPINLITISDFHHDPIDIRDRLKAGEDLAVSWNKRPLCYIRHLTREEREAWETRRELPKGAENIMGMFSLRTSRRNEFIDDIRQGKVFVLAIYKQPWGVAFNYFPKRTRDEFPKLFEREKR
jgi:hypothetical protein